MKRAIDVSNWQGNIDWNKVNNSSIDFVYSICADGNFTGKPAGAPLSVKDSYQRNKQLCKKPFGPYYFARPGGALSVDQAAAFAIDQAGPVNLPFMLDLEQSNLNREDTIVWCNRWCQIVHERTNRLPLFYVGAFFLAPPLVNDRRLQDCIWWLPAYTSNQVNPDPDKISKPDTNKATKPWDIWQYTSQGRVDGIPGNVDMNLVTEEAYNYIVQGQGDNDMTPEEYRLETTGQKELSVRDFLAKWISDSRRTIKLIQDGRTNKYWAVFGLFKMEVSEPYSGWWRNRSDVADYTGLGPQTEGQLISEIDETAEVSKDEFGKLVLSTKSDVTVNAEDVVKAFLSHIKV